MKRFAIWFVSLIVIASALPTAAQFTFDDMLSQKRVSDPQLSPDGRYVIYNVGVVNKAENRVLTQIFRSAVDGSEIKQLTEGNTSNSSGRWSMDGKYIAYNTGGQIWVMNADGSGKRQVTKYPTGASGPVWSPDGKWLLFRSDVYPECTTEECNTSEEEKAKNSKVQAKITERLLFKHWNEWRDRKRTHVFLISVDGGAARDLTPGDFDSPPYSASTGHDYSFSPDGKEVIFIKNLDPIEAASTNSDLFVMPIAGGQPRNITANNKGYDASPFYTPDGKYILFRSQKTATFEADRWRLMRFSRQTGETQELTIGFDEMVDEFILSPDGKTVYFTAGARGKHPVYSVPLEPDFRMRIRTHVRQLPLTDKYPFITGINIAPDNKTLVFSSMSMTSPPEIYAANIDGSAGVALSKANGDLGLRRPEEIEWIGAENTPNHGFIVKPKNFDANRKYPMIVLIHGGPQGAWNDAWSTRWNPQVWANAGYVIFMPNPRGSTGYGQQFVNEISGDWGGKVFIDIKNGIVEMLKRPYVDKERIGGAGASYGGYMVDWILGHNDDPRFKFKALLSHAGVYNLESMATSTEEIFFVNWEFKGMPWENPEMYEKWSPHKFVKNFNTPTLITHGELDFRVPVDQSLQLFTALQLRKVPSRLVIFPDEGHWILKPQNSELWHKEVLGWFGKYLNP